LLLRHFPFTITTPELDTAVTLLPNDMQHFRGDARYNIIRH